ncbi:dysbindin domain-containing protein 2 [Conger conger]|uniref:dysbindin domain-containing protein 2 n=1 Tax=Conger conger TaxID=82655 RepID=UPI002A5A2E69|nr:dysbindin domain-containing protein 2 [Conger conger]
MTSPGSSLHSKRLTSETERAQRVPAATRQMKRRDRQRFFEDVFQHDVDVYLSAAHLQIEHKRPPIGSISSMEVNVDMLEQMEHIDLSDQDTLDVFFHPGAEEGMSSPLPGADDEDDSDEDDDEKEERKGHDAAISLQVPEGCEAKFRMWSTSSASTDPCSLDPSEEGGDTPVVQSDEEDVHADHLLLTATPPATDEEEKPSVSS